MTLQTPVPDRGADTRRHKLVGDVHLILVNPAGEVLFGQRHNTGYEDGAWHVPSGHLEAGESVVAALIREAREEIGVVIGEQDVEFAHIMHNYSSGGRVAFFFTVRRWAGVPANREPGKCEDFAGSRSGRCPAT
jgi:8-oxo-dGTP diphosphatase